MNKFIDRFVTAKLAGVIDCRQGWVVNAFPEKNLFIIRGQSGKLYVCENTPAIVENPPKRNY